MVYAQTPWVRYTKTLEKAVLAYDPNFQKFAKITAHMIAETCRQPGDILPILKPVRLQGTFSLPTNTEEECDTIRQEGFLPVCLRLEPSSIPYIHGFKTWNVAWPSQYYQTDAWPETFPDVALAFTCSFGPQHTFKQFYVGPSSVKWQSDRSYRAVIQTANGPLEAFNRTLHIHSNIPSLAGPHFETWITAVSPQQ